jgi:hypothetical protein
MSNLINKKIIRSFLPLIILAVFAVGFLVFYSSVGAATGSHKINGYSYQCDSHGGQKSCSGPNGYFPSNSNYNSVDITYQVYGHRHSSNAVLQAMACIKVPGGGVCSWLNCTGGSCGGPVGGGHPMNILLDSGTLNLSVSGGQVPYIYAGGLVNDAQMRIDITYAEAFYDTGGGPIQCPSGQTWNGSSCVTPPPTALTCGAAGGNYCADAGDNSCGGFTTYTSSDCSSGGKTCCSIPSCGGAGGNTCTSGNSCDPYTILTAYDCSVQQGQKCCDIPGGGGSSNAGQPCESGANSCGQTNWGSYTVTGSCSAITPSDSACGGGGGGGGECAANAGQLCTSGANSCGQTGTGTWQCDGSCSAGVPSDDGCVSTQVCEDNGTIWVDNLAILPSTFDPGETYNFTLVGSNETGGLNLSTWYKSGYRMRDISCLTVYPPGHASAGLPTCGGGQAPDTLPTSPATHWTGAVPPNQGMNSRFYPQFTLVAPMAIGTYTLQMTMIHNSGWEYSASPACSNSIPLSDVEFGQLWEHEFEVAGPMTGTLNSDAPSCVIGVGASTCSMHFWWHVDYPEDPGGSKVTKAPSITMGTGDDGSDSWAISRFSTTFYLYNNNKELAQKTVNANCDPAVSTWDGTKCVAIPPVMSGWLTPSFSSCIVPLGGSSCTKELTWGTAYPVGVSAVTSATGTPSPRVGNSGTDTFTVPYNINGVYFFLYNNSDKLAEARVDTSCALGSAWDGAKCAATSLMTGILLPSASSCIINVNASNCTINFSWDVSKPEVPGGSIVTKTGGATVSTGDNRTNVPLVVKYSTETFTLKNNNVNLDAETVTSSCASGSTWDFGTSKCVATGGEMYGTLTPATTACTILLGESNCTINFSWTVTNPQSTSAVRKSDLVVVATGHTGVSVPLVVKYNTETFELINNGISLDTETVNSSCEAGSAWDGAVCVDDPYIGANPVIIFTGDSTTLTWSSEQSPCTGTNFDTQGVSAGSVEATPNSTTTYTVTCGTDATAVTVTVRKKPTFIEN